jgi:putative transcriptional regulator
MEKARGRNLGPGRVDKAKVEATTEEDTRRHMIEDGLHPDDPLAGFTVRSKVVDVRRKADLSQDAFARALRVPVKTIRNWEQGRSKPDPAARALLAIVDDDPARAFRAIARRMSGIAADDLDSALEKP